MLKKLMEQRSALLAELDKMVKGLETENKEEIRAFTAEEQKTYDEKKGESRGTERHYFKHFRGAFA